jgi:two-component sensor histidine kinase
MAIMAAGQLPGSVRTARDFTSRTLADWDLCALAADAAVVVSELVTNALLHGSGPGSGVAGPPAELVLWGRASQLICVVTDSSPLPPVRGTAGLAAESGRGLVVVQALARAWGWTLLGLRRKAVWAALG